MTRITRAEHVLVALRAQLERLKRPGANDRANPKTLGPLARARELAHADNVSEADLARALVANLLAEELGADLAGEPRFQSIVNEVTDIISADEKSLALLRDAIRQLQT